MRFASAFAMLLATAMPAAAQLPDPLAMTTDPADRAVMAEAAAAVATRAPSLAQLDAVLAKLPRPTPLRGMVQTVRAGLLQRERDAGPAVAAVEEAMRLLPDDPRPKLVASGIFTFSGSPARAADLWLQASRESPDLARMSDRYVMMALTGRLTELGDRTRADRISARLGEIGFSAGLAPERSGAALGRVREAVRAGRIDDALAGVSAVSDPDDLLTLYIDQRYAALWPRIAEWAGADLSAQTRRYLEELRADWTVTDDFRTATPYARSLGGLNAYATVVTLFAPMFDRVQPGTQNDEVEFLAPVVARAYATTGRMADAKGLLAKVAAALPQETYGNSLNIDGAYLTLASLDNDWAEVVARADSFLAQAAPLGASVNRASIVQVQAWRACGLFQAGRTAEAERAVAEVVMAAPLAPDPVMDMHLCRGDQSAARALVIARLADENTRDWALRFVQPVTPDTATPLARMMRPISEAVRTAPDVVAAAKRYGRILPQPVDAALPAGFDPFRTPTPRPPARDSV